jgi:hypothetical protein
MKYAITLLVLVSSTSYAIEPITLVSGALGIISSLYTLTKDEDVKTPTIQVMKEEIPVGYHYENVVDVSCNCVKRILVANVTTEYPF